MRYYIHLSLLLLFTCQIDQANSIIDVPKALKPKNNLTYLQLINQLGDETIEAMVQKPKADGSQGRNQQGYFHVRFQMGIGTIAAYAVHFKSQQALDFYISSLNYCFQHQKATGDFDLKVPTNLKKLGNPHQGDLASGQAFFLSALGSSLQLFKQSVWFQQAPELTKYRQTVAQLENEYQKALHYLKTQQSVLIKFDGKTANRLFFDALAYYSMGDYLQDEEALTLAQQFIEKALDLQSKEGYFIEKQGFDTSYNGVSNWLGLQIYCLLAQNHPLKKRLWVALEKSMRWQANNVLHSGEISLTGNTRVFDGGEQFLGQEKGIAWKDSALSFYGMKNMTNLQEYQQLANRIRLYYQ